ncbi:MAG: PIN domain-containing protein [Desulfobacterales bacterium]|nr:PIN domain-containing protein [Desulfobacterales bacterium]
MPRINSIVLDSFALIGFLENEKFSFRIESLLKQARNGECRIYLHAIHLGEVYYIILREQGQDLADLAYARIKAFPLTYIDTIDELLLRTAAKLKANYPISYADAFAAAMAVIHNSSLLTGDPEFKILEKKEAITIEWLV